MATKSSGDATFDLPPVSFYFEVKIDTFSTDIYFSEVSGLDMELEAALEIKEGGNNSYTYSLPGRTKYGDLVLKRGTLVKKSILYEWVQKVITGNYSTPIEPKNITISLLDEEGNASVSWSVVNAYPKKMQVSDLNAKASGDSAILIETLTFSYSEFTRVSS